MTGVRAGGRPVVLAGVAVLLFLIWSNSFVAVSFLLGGEGAPARFDWVGLTIARFQPAAVICAGYCLTRRREALAILREHPLRLAVAGLLAVPAYNLALYYGQQHGVPAPVASVTTGLAPLFLMLLSAAFLGERLTAARLLGFAVAAAGLVVIAGAREDDPNAGPAGYATVVAVTTLAPLSWSLFSILTKPLTARVSPLLWTYLAIVVGTLPILPLLPIAGGAELTGLDAAGWGALLFLSVPCTVLGFALWTWLLGHLPASTVGLTVFLNPPLTTLSKLVLATLFPASFLFVLRTGEWIGGALTLVGLAIAILGSVGSAGSGRRRAPRVAPASPAG